MHRKPATRNKLWTRNFSIITFGTIISMLGNAVSGFTVGLLVLEIANSVLLYAVYNVLYNIPKVIMPTLAGPYLDRFSRRRMIFTLDFISSGMYLLMFLALTFGVITTSPSSYPLMLIFCIIIGTIDSIYQVAYESLYPMLITEGNYSKAYSISSMIYPLAALMTPVAAYVSDAFGMPGIRYLFLFNSLSFLGAAIFETQIKIDELQALGKSEKKTYGISKFISDFKNGIGYLRKEKGLRTITGYFFVSVLVDAAVGILLLPYFKSNATLGVFTYTIITGVNLLGRLLGGVYHYKVYIPKDNKFTIAMCVYIVANTITCLYLFTNFWVMIAMQLFSGMICVTSYNIRISSTQNYVPNEMRGRFNGVFQTFMSLGTIVGQLAAGALCELQVGGVEIFNPLEKAEAMLHFLGNTVSLTGIEGTRLLVIGFAMLNYLAMAFIMFPGRRNVSKIYNVDI
ncbi:MAG: MFS transporter [Clostridia bacterium]|nr:MFS transporter [Clostridia bacterium]